MLCSVVNTACLPKPSHSVRKINTRRQYGSLKRKICRNCDSTVLYCECVSLPLCHYPAVVSSDICLPQPLWKTLPTLKRELTPFSFVFVLFFVDAAKVSLSLVFILGSFSTVHAFSSVFSFASVMWAFCSRLLSCVRGWVQPNMLLKTSQLNIMAIKRREVGAADRCITTALQLFQLATSSFSQSHR